MACFWHYLHFGFGLGFGADFETGKLVVFYGDDGGFPYNRE